MQKVRLQWLLFLVQFHSCLVELDKGTLSLGLLREGQHCLVRVMDIIGNSFCTRTPRVPVFSSNGPGYMAQGQKPEAMESTEDAFYGSL